MRADRTHWRSKNEQSGLPVSGLAGAAALFLAVLLTIVAYGIVTL